MFSSAQIYEAVWREPAYDPGRTVAVHVRHIREKIEAKRRNTPIRSLLAWGKIEMSAISASFVRK